MALTVGVADAEGDSDADAEADGEALPDDDADADTDADTDAEAEAEGDWLALGSTMHGSGGALVCSVAGADASEAMAAVPVPKVAKIRLAETVIATPPVSRAPRVRAWLRSAERRERAVT